MDWSHIGDAASGLARAGDFLTAVTGILALYLALRSLPPVNRRLAQSRLAWTRWVRLRRALRRPKAAHGLRIPTLRDHVRRAGLRFDGIRMSPAWEVDWVSKRLGLRTSLTFAHEVDDALLLRLALAYRQVGSALQVRSLLGGPQPLLEREAALCQEVYLHLVHHANVVSQESALPDIGPPSSNATSRALPDSAWFPVGRPDSSIRLPTARGGEFCGECLISTSWFRHRLVYERGVALKRIAEQDESELEIEARSAPDELAVRLDQQIAKPHGYDGVLPRLTGWRHERDKGTGASILHVSLSEISYQAHLIISDPAQDPHHVDDAQILTLSLVVITRDDYIVAVRRSSGDSWYPDCWGPSVNGNLDIPVPGRKDSDRDDWGFPDLKAALAREAHEELGLQIDASHIAIDGIAQIASATEQGTYVLASSAFVPHTLAEIREGVRFADRVLGAWELQGDALAIPRPRTHREAVELLAWLWNDSQVMPHLVASLTLFLLNAQLIDRSQWGSWQILDPRTSRPGEVHRLDS